MTTSQPIQEVSLSHPVLKALDVLECLAAANLPSSAFEVAEQWSAPQNPTIAFLYPG